MFGCGMGLKGAAIATAAAQWVGALAFLGLFWRARASLPLLAETLVEREADATSDSS